MSDVYVVGVGMTPFGRHLDKSLRQLTGAAVASAMADAGVRSDQIEAAFFGNAVQGHMEGQHMVRGQVALGGSGLTGIPVMNVENACATGSSAFSLAVTHLKAGEADIVLAAGAEKLFSDKKDLSFAAFDSGWDVSTITENQNRLLHMGQGLELPADAQSDEPYSMAMDVYAAFARHRMRLFGITQRQLAAISSKNHGHSVHNPLAQFRRAFTIDEVLAARKIAYPLTVPMCSPISDGAAAAILATADGLRRLGLDVSRAVRIRAVVVQTGTERDADDVAAQCTALAARKAYEKAGIGPDDVDVAEVHDATAVGEVIQAENLGFCALGEGGVIAERGDTTIGGRIPINPSGGLESKGHPIGATGIGQIHELVTQLRGEAKGRQVEGARIAVAENGGGLVGVEEAVAVITVLERP